MTDKEAIEELKARKEHYEMGDGCEFLVEALEKGIEALENQSSVIEELEKIKAEIEKLEYDDFDCNLALPAWKVYDIINNYIAELKGEDLHTIKETLLKQEEVADDLMN